MLGNHCLVSIYSGGSRGGFRGTQAPPLFWQTKKNKQNIEKTQEEEKPAEQAIFANQFYFNTSKKTAAPLARGLDPPLI